MLLYDRVMAEKERTDKTMNNVKTGQFILSCRKELGLTQNQLAEKLNLTDKAISKWENGKSAPDIATLVPLADVLGVSVVEILNGKRMASVELQAESDYAIVDTMKKSKKKMIICVICTILIVLFLFSLVPAYHYFSTISGNMDALIEDAYAFSGSQNYEENRVLKTIEKGDYIALFIESPQSVSCVIYRQDEIFEDRYSISMGSPCSEKGIMHISASGENGLALNVLYGADLPPEYSKYTFKYQGCQYICPIENGYAFDFFIEASGYFSHAYDLELLQ